MTRIITLGLPALALVTSCVPQEVASVGSDRTAGERPVSEGHALLRRLALDAPALDDLPLTAADAPVSITPVAAPPFAAGPQGEDDAARATDCLTAAVYYEARSESLDGQRAVAQVVLNRVRDRAFPATVCGVVYQGSARRTGCQFSFTCDGSMDRPREPAAWERARAVATAALAGSVYEPIGSATYYHAASVLPWWASSLSRIGSVGAHIFYRWRDRMESALAFHQDYAGEEPRVALRLGAGPTPAGGALVQGVAVHIGTPADVQAGVTIHHGIAPAVASPAASAFAGVRIHFGAVQDGSGDAPTAAEDVTL